MMKMLAPAWRRISNRALLMAIVLIAIGVPGAVMSPFSDTSPELYFWLWFASFLSIGAGVGTLLGKKMIGCLLGLGLGVALFIWEYDAKF